VNTRSSPAIAAIAAALALTGCASTGSSGNTGSTESTETQAAANNSASSAPASPPCQTQALAWKNGGGASHIGAIVSDLSAIQQAFAATENTGTDPSSADSALQSAAALLRSEVRTAEAALPPACIPGLRFPYRQALTDYSNAAGDFQETVSELRRGNDSVAMADAQAGTNAIGAGNTKFDAADAALNTFVNSQS
jgi:hypothetical protein